MTKMTLNNEIRTVQASLTFGETHPGLVHSFQAGHQAA